MTTPSMNTVRVVTPYGDSLKLVSSVWVPGKVPQWILDSGRWESWRSAARQTFPNIGFDDENGVYFRTATPFIDLLNLMYKHRAEWVERRYARRFELATPTFGAQCADLGGPCHRMCHLGWQVPWPEIVNVADYRSQAADRLFGDELIAVLNMPIEEIKAEIVARGIAGHQAVWECRWR